MATSLRSTRITSGPQFRCTRSEIIVVSKIAKRAVCMALDAGVAYKHQDAMMDIEACHSNGCPLKLEELLAADDGNFGHDVFGIRRFIDRETGKLGDGFWPRFAMPAVAS
jgi:hypothetical protein